MIHLNNVNLLNRGQNHQKEQLYGFEVTHLAFIQKF